MQQGPTQGEEKKKKPTGKKRRKLLALTPLKVQMALGQVHLEEEEGSTLAKIDEDEAALPPKARRTGEGPIFASLLRPMQLLEPSQWGRDLWN